ncbi:MAG: cysteine desulfurase [Flexilinea sp.]|nr:cysteine desulfurase [Flexilinea sp.]
MKIYADNAATTKMSRPALEAMTACLAEVYGNPSSLHSAGQEAYQALTDAREKIAALLGCQANEIIFTSGGTEADNQALRSAATLGARSGKKHIVSTAFEHHAILHTLDRLKTEGFEITLLEVPPNGILSPEQVMDAVRSDTCLVTVMYANNEIGTIQPVSEIGAGCRSKGVLFHTDAVQAVGHLSLNLREEDVDMLSLSAHKFHGPKGVGLLYCRRGTPLSSLIHGGAQEKGRRAGTENVPGIVGMAAALEDSLKDLPLKQQRISSLRDTLIRNLAKIPGAYLNGDAEMRLSGNVNFSFEGIDGEALLMILDEKGIAASSGSACTAGSMEPSHVLLALGRSFELAKGSLRLTLDEENTGEEVETISKEVSAGVTLLRKIG